MKRIALGILAHVDAGKTTLSESLLYNAGVIKRLGRVDNRDAFLDTDAIERSRGITIFSKQAVLEYNDNCITLLDTPGHVDFSAEMERALWVMDYAILVISAPDGVLGHTKTLWRLLRRYRIPTFIFVNKMDQPGMDKRLIMDNLREQLGSNLIDFSGERDEAFWESVAVCEESVLERYLNTEQVSEDDIVDMVAERNLFPCFFGSALKDVGVKEMLQQISLYTRQHICADDFGGKVYKIGRDNMNNRLTYLKVTSGTLQVKQIVNGEKINQIRVYSGEHFETMNEVAPGYVCAVTGLTDTYPGQGIGMEQDAQMPVLEPVLTYTVELPDDMDAARMFPLLKQLEEEDPQLHLLWQEETQTIQIKLMGVVQLEVLQKRIEERFHVEVRFGMGRIAYKETIEDTVEGVGHFEPLRHYAEVHLLMEPLEQGSGLQFATDCSEDVLDKNWQRLVMTHLEEKEHVGVLTGSPITDMKITLVSGKAHTKHTEGGDFRQATYRAVRQGLMQASSKLLEPYYSFCLEIPASYVGRAMTDIENMCGKSQPPELLGERAVLRGTVPVASFGDYQITVSAYTKGEGTIQCELAGYGPCHDEDEVIRKMNYDPELDKANPTGSVFCSHGSGYVVSWNEVKDYMHMDSVLEPEISVWEEMEESEIVRRKAALTDYSLDEEQIQSILRATSHANERESKHYRKKRIVRDDSTYKGMSGPAYNTRYVIVDGYNIVHAWDDLKALVDDNLDGARQKLLDILCNYQAFLKCELIVVFDAYKVKGNLGEMYDYHNIHVVYTKEAETADAYIEKLTHQISKDYYVTVATSDGLVQLITRGQNCTVMSARELLEDVDRVNEQIRQYLNDN